MINFGVHEVANSKATTAPGWTYVPDTGVNASVTALQPSSKRRRVDANVSHHETSARQEQKILRELAALDRENQRDVPIQVPTKARAHGKMTPAVKKIITSQKTFANHLSDYEASASSAAPLPAPLPAQPSSHGVPSTPVNTTGKRAYKKRELVNSPAPSPLRKASTAAELSSPIKVEDSAQRARTGLSLGTAKEPLPHDKDDDPLLVSRIPQLPSSEELDKLRAMPPLGYNEARGVLVEEDKRKPARKFCEVCGYWGRVKCMRCGGRVCALECLNVHQEECFTRYGA